MPATRSRSNNTTTARTQEIEALSSSEGGKTKKSSVSPPKGSLRGARQRRKRQLSASPVTPPTGPRKRKNEHPGLIGKKARRTKAEVLAEKAAKEAEAEALEAANAAALVHLATMEVDQEYAEAGQDQRIIRRQPSFPNAFPSDEELDLSSSGETEVDSDDDSDDGKATPLDDNACIIGKTKAHKTRELLTQVAERKKLMKKRGTRKGNTTMAPLASGLKGSWKHKAQANRGLVQDVAILGGLSDKHTSATRPKFEKRQHDAGPQVVEEIVGVISDDEIDAFQPVRVRVKKIKKGRSLGKESETTLPIDDAPTMSTNPRIAARAARVVAGIFPKASNRANIIKSEPAVRPSSLVAGIKSAKKFTELPRSFNQTLIKKFRATCYHAWMTSDDPFDTLSLDSDDLLKIVRDAFAEAFADVDYVPENRDIFHKTIYDNLQTQRSNVAHDAVEAVTMSLSELSPQEVIQWAIWTRNARLGELIYSEPCPPGCSLDRKQPNFQKPKGLFMTHFVIGLATPFLKYMDQSLIDYGHPRGLIALILVSLERALRAFEVKGIYKYPGPFTSNSKALLIEYLESVDNFTKWEDFYEACNFTRQSSSFLPDGGFAADTSQIDIGRRALNFSSSPVRG